MTDPLTDAELDWFTRPERWSDRDGRRDYAVRLVADLRAAASGDAR